MYYFESLYYVEIETIRISTQKFDKIINSKSESVLVEIKKLA